MGTIQELTETFQNFGGRFENVALGHGEDRGYYLYTLDTEKDIFVSCPDDLFVNRDDIGISKSGLYITRPENYANRIDFLQEYFAFHFNRKVMEHYLAKRHLINSLPKKDITLISKIFPTEWKSAAGLSALEYVKNQIIRSHVIRYAGNNIIMPFMSFINHHKYGIPFNDKEGAISICGKFSDEVYAVYNDSDSILFSCLHGFATDTRFAYSVPAANTLPNGIRLVINRNINEKSHNADGAPIPIVKKNQNTITISWFPLHIENFPDFPAQVAQMIAIETGLSAEMILQGIIHANYTLLQEVFLKLGKSKNAFSRMVTAAVEKQLNHFTITK